MERIIGHWYNIEACVQCKTRIDPYRSATCYKCGHISMYGTADTYKIVLRTISTKNNRPWWMFWESQWDVVYEGKTVHDHEWVIENLNKV
jgi:hypothetical protein